jgi:hypothetical protein
VTPFTQEVEELTILARLGAGYDPACGSTSPRLLATFGDEHRPLETPGQDCYGK